MTIVRTDPLTWRNWGRGGGAQKEISKSFFSHLIYFSILLATYSGALNLDKLSLSWNQYSTVYMRRASKNLPQRNLFSVPFLAHVYFTIIISCLSRNLVFVIFKHDINSGLNISNQWNKTVHSAPYFHVTSLL